MAAIQDGSAESDVPVNSLSPRSNQVLSSKSGKTDSTDRSFSSVNGGMTTATAAGTPKQAANGQSSNSTPAPYGTRSRNRGAPRPNYAEDRDLDDLELLTTSKPASSKKASSTSQSVSRTSPAANDRSTGVSTRRARANSNSYAPSTKDAIPGTSTFSANPNATNGSKKRKQPGTTTTTQMVFVPANPNQPNKKFLVGASRAPELECPTNMMTFHNSRGCLKNGKLKADDGTVLAVNGTWLFCTLTLSKPIADLSSF